MNLLEITNTVIVVIGVPTTLAAALFVGRKLQILDLLEASINNEIKPELKDIRNRLEDLTRRITILEMVVLKGLK